MWRLSLGRNRRRVRPRKAPVLPACRRRSRSPRPCRSHLRHLHLRPRRRVGMPISTRAATWWSRPRPTMPRPGWVVRTRRRRNPRVVACSDGSPRRRRLLLLLPRHPRRSPERSRLRWPRPIRPTMAARAMPASMLKATQASAYPISTRRRRPRGRRPRAGSPRSPSAGRRLPSTTRTCRGGNCVWEWQWPLRCSQSGSSGFRAGR